MSTIQEIKDKVVVFTEGKDWKGIAVIVLLIIVGACYFFWPKPPIPVNTTQIMNEAKKAVEAQLKPIIVKKEEEIKVMQQERDDYKSRGEVSDAKYKALTKKYIELKGSVTNVAPPKTDKELRDRFIFLGLPPTPSGVCGPGYICFSTGYK
jgi:hypothetical protein